MNYSNGNVPELKTALTCGIVVLLLKTMRVTFVNGAPKLVSCTLTKQHLWGPPTLIHCVRAEILIEEKWNLFSPLCAFLEFFSLRVYPSVWTSAHHKLKKEKFFPKHVVKRHEEQGKLPTVHKKLWRLCCQVPLEKSHKKTTLNSCHLLLRSCWQPSVSHLSSFTKGPSGDCMTQATHTNHKTLLTHPL